jgi:hypothetical protein
MPGAAQIVSFFQTVTILGSALTAVKLLLSGLYRRYRIFFAFFVFRVPCTTSLLLLSRLKGLYGGDGTSSWAYFYVFYYSEPVLILLCILVVVELYGLVLEQYRGLYTLGRRVMYGALAISTAISLWTLRLRMPASTPEPSKKLYYEIYTERGVDFALVIFILLIGLFLSRYPIPLNRNVLTHTAIYSVFFLSDSTALLWRMVFGSQVIETINLIATGVSSACTLAWFLLLSARGEEVKVHAPELRPDSEERVLHQLDQLNATLLGISRK